MSDLDSEEIKSIDVFVSHSHDDWEMAQSLATKLVDEGLRVWFDRWVLVPGRHWQTEMANGLDHARTCAVCIGVNTPKGWFSQEIQRALNRQSRDVSFRVIPVILPKGSADNIGDFLDLRTWVEFKDNINDDSAFHLLVCGILGKSPGRYRPPTKPDVATEGIIERLKLVKVLREGGLIDLEVAIGFQRDIVGPVIRRQGEVL